MDLQTLAIALFISSALQVGALAAQWRIAGRHPGSGWWAAGVGAVSLGFGAMMLRSVPGWTALGLFGNNVLFVLGHLLLWVGARRLFGLAVAWRPLLAFLAAYAAAAAWFSFGFDHLVWRGSLLYASIAGISFLTARTLWLQHPEGLQLTARFLAAVFASHGLIFIAGLVLGLVAPPPSNSPTGPNLGQLIGLLDGLIVLTVWTFGFILMVNQRLSAGYRETRDEIAMILDGTPDVVVLTRMDDGRLVETNAAFAEVMGYDRHAVLGQCTTALGLWADPADRLRLVEMLRERGHCTGVEFAFRRRDGSLITCEVSARRLVLKQVEHVLAVIHDVSERKQMQQQLERLASTDPLTGLLNRRRFMALARYELRRARRLRQPLCLALVDMDHFKQLNDNHGHAAGDAALQHLADLCRAQLRGVDLVARMGGDEFALLLPQTDAPQALVVLQRLHAAMAQRTVPMPVSLSIGVADWAPAAHAASVQAPAPEPPPREPPVPALTEAPAADDPADAPAQEQALQSLLARADQALYAVKRAGRNGTRVG